MAPSGSRALIALRMAADMIRAAIMLTVLQIGSVMAVVCGGHSAATCADCPQGNGAAWCNGECRWENNACVTPNVLCSASTGTRANHCGVCPSGAAGCPSGSSRSERAGCSTAGRAGRSPPMGPPPMPSTGSARAQARILRSGAPYHSARRERLHRTSESEDSVLEYISTTYGLENIR